tara:strand:+ start:329 stop:895 length:567 start_codon:yes stop_codon:yes gene_type:complete
MIDFIECYDALSSEKCKEIIDYCEESGKFHEGLVGEGVVDKNIKDSFDYSGNFEENTLVDKILVDTLSKFIPKYIEKHPQTSTVIAPWSLQQGYNIQKYIPGGGYPFAHCETSGPTCADRVLVWMIYLNTVEDDDYGGGTYFQNYQKAIKAVEGRLVIWPAYWTHTHHGIISKNKTKYIATGWFGFHK